MDRPPALTPLILLVDDQEWTSRSIESILRPKGYVVLKAYTGQQASDLVQKVSPDALIVDVHLPDIHGVDLVRQLRGSPTITSITPILMVTGGTVGRAERLEALGAGAWDILTQPVDPNELVLRMETFVRAKQDVDRIRDEGLTDPGTGFYNARGLLRRAAEIGADAIRSERPMTCVAFGPPLVAGAGRDSDAAIESLARRVAAALRTVTRASDTIGRLGPGEFIVVAPDTDQEGSVRLADRVLEAVEQSSGLELVDPALLKQIRAGFSAMRATEPTTAEDLLLRATTALRRAQTEEGGAKASFRVRSFEA